MNLGDADLTQVNWRGVRKLDECVHESSVLKQPAVRELLSTGHGRGRSYVRMDLHGANLTGADLHEANLKEANCAGTDFSGANLTGAVIESWNIDAATKLNDAQCRFVFLLEKPDVNGDRKRRPADAERSFEPGEFEQLYTKILEEMEILLKKGLSPSAMREAFAELREKHPDVNIRKIEDRDTHVLVGLDVPYGTDAADVDRVLVSKWELQFRIAEAEKKQIEAHNRDIKEMFLAAAVAGPAPVTVQVGDRKMENNSIKVGNINNSQLGSVKGNVSNLTQTLHQTATSGEGGPELASALTKLLEHIESAKEIGALAKVEAKGQVELIAAAAQAPREEAASSTAGKAFERLTTVLGKVPDVTKLLEAAGKAWELVAKTAGAAGGS